MTNQEICDSFNREIDKIINISIAEGRICEHVSQIAFNDQLREILECACMHAALNSQCALKIGEALNLLMQWNKL